jgi:hypothetical protein
MLDDNDVGGGCAAAANGYAVLSLTVWFSEQHKGLADHLLDAS